MTLYWVDKKSGVALPLDSPHKRANFLPHPVLWERKLVVYFRYLGSAFRSTLYESRSIAFVREI